MLWNRGAWRDAYRILSVRCLFNDRAREYIKTDRPIEKLRLRLMQSGKSDTALFFTGLIQRVCAASDIPELRKILEEIEVNLASQPLQRACLQI